MKKLILVITVMILTVAFVKADFYVKSQTHIPPMEMMGQKTPEKNDISEQWLGKDKFAMVSSQQTMVIDLTSQKMYFIYPSKKSYVETSLPLDMSKLLPKEMAGMMSMMKMTVKINPLGQTKTIKGKKCDGYQIDMNMAMMPMKSIAWLTTDVPFDWKAYSEKMYSHYLKATLVYMDPGSISEFKKLKGFQVAQETTMSIMGKEMKTTMEVLEISEKTPPAGLYAVPAGYKKIDNIIGMK